MKRILIAYSHNFRNKNIFNQKIESILKNTDSYSITAVHDKNLLIENKFQEKITNRIEKKLAKRDIEKLVKSHDNIILFWDGTDIDLFIYQALLQKKSTRIITIETTKVANKDRGEEYDVYIGRGTPWGNPYAIGDDGMSRDDVIKKYKEYFSEKFLSNPERLRELKSLKNKTLGCHCKPHACHGDIISEYLNSID